LSFVALEILDDQFKKYLARLIQCTDFVSYTEVFGL